MQPGIHIAARIAPPTTVPITAAFHRLHRSPCPRRTQKHFHSPLRSVDRYNTLHNTKCHDMSLNYHSDNLRHFPHSFLTTPRPAFSILHLTHNIHLHQRNPKLLFPKVPIQFTSSKSLLSLSLNELISAFPNHLALAFTTTLGAHSGRPRTALNSRSSPAQDSKACFPESANSILLLKTSSLFLISLTRANAVLRAISNSHSAERFP